MCDHINLPRMWMGSASRDIEQIHYESISQCVKNSAHTYLWQHASRNPHLNVISFQRYYMGRSIEQEMQHRVSRPHVDVEGMHPVPYACDYWGITTCARLLL